jgi:hypothetical protein
MKNILFSFFLFSGFFSLNAFAGSQDYQCQILTDSGINDKGSLDLRIDSLRIGKKFAVDRKTGEVIGGVLFALDNPKVMAFGSEQNSFIVLWAQEAGGKNGAFVEYLTIREYAKGKKKPFGFFTGGMLLTGLCD